MRDAHFFFEKILNIHELFWMLIRICKRERRRENAEYTETRWDIVCVLIYLYAQRILPFRGGECVIDQYIEQYGKRLFGLCRTLCAGMFDAEDLYQETWLKVCQKIHRYRASEPFEPWLTAICVNTYRDMLRRNKSSPIFNDFGSSEEKEMMMEKIPAQSGDPYKSVASEFSELKEAIDRLPEKMRVVIILYYFHDWDIHRTAIALRIPEGTVKSRLHQAKKILRKELADEPDLQF